MGWSNKPTNFALRVVSDADAFTKKVTGEVLQRVIIATPVDTGQARGNWRVSVGSPETSVIEATDRSGQGAISKGLATIQSGGGIGKVVYISNNLRYISKLNSGWSMQAPANFVELSLQSVVNKYR